MSVVAEPAPGSLMPMPNMYSPLAHLGRKRFFCSSEPRISITRDGPLTANWQISAVLKQTREISSRNTVACRMDSPEPPYCSGMTRPR